MLLFDASTSLLSECCVGAGQEGGVACVSTWWGDGGWGWGCGNYQLPNGRHSQEINRCKERAKLEKLGGNCKRIYFMCEILQTLGLRTLDSIGFLRKSDFQPVGRNIYNALSVREPPNWVILS